MSCTHASHPDIINRLKRVEGHLRSVIGMIEAGRTCLELAQQLHAVEAAVTKAKRELIHDHLDHCLDGRDGAASASASDLAELRQLAKYL